jgi:antitoxin MazE
MRYNEAETRFYLIDPVLRNKGYNEYWKLRLETPAPVEPTGKCSSMDIQLHMYIRDRSDKMQVSKWGNSLAVRLPAALVEKMKLKEGDHVHLKPVGRNVLTIGRQAEIDALFESLRKYRGRVPAAYKFDREEASRR